MPPLPLPPPPVPAIEQTKPADARVGEEVAGAAAVASIVGVGGAASDLSAETVNASSTCSGVPAAASTGDEAQLAAPSDATTSPPLQHVPAPTPLSVEIIDAAGAVHVLEYPRVSEWRGSFTLYKPGSTKEKKKELKVVTDRFTLHLGAPGDRGDMADAAVPISAVVAQGYGGCAIGTYELKGTLRFGADGLGVLSCTREYTGAPKPRSPTRPRPSATPRPVASSADAAAAAAAEASARRASGRVRVKSRFFEEGFEADADGGGDSAGKGAGGGAAEGGPGGVPGGGGSGKKRKIGESNEDGGGGGAGGSGEVSGKGGKKKAFGGKGGSGGPFVLPGRDDTPNVSVFWGAHLWFPPGQSAAGAPSGEGDECIYEGEILHGLPHGRGTLVYPNGLMFEGNWANGRESGWGFLSSADDEPLWAGEVLDGVPHGNGTYFYSNGDTYSGAWKEGLPHGRGSFESNQHGKYDGMWAEGQRAGPGTQTYVDGSVYRGAWRSGQRHGRGDLTMPDGFRYSGMWAVDVMEGKGAVDFPDGGRYEGGMKGGRREGRGTYTFPHGQQVSGRWISDKLAPDPSGDAANNSSTSENAGSYIDRNAGTVIIPRSFIIPASEATGVQGHSEHDIIVMPINLHQSLTAAHRIAGFSDEGE